MRRNQALTIGGMVLAALMLAAETSAAQTLDQPQLATDTVTQQKEA